MRWPWSRRRWRENVLGGGDLGLVQRAVRSNWSGSKVNFELGNTRFQRLRPEMWQDLFLHLGSLNRPYQPGRRECENFSQARLVQVSNFITDRTDLDLSANLFEIRGKELRRVDGVDVWRPHSLLFIVHDETRVELRQPYDHGLLTAHPLERFKDPWLVYS